METGIQVSSLRPLLKTAEEVDRAFEKIASLGIRTVQLQWIDRSVSASDIAAALQKNGLRSVSVQDFYTSFAEDREYYMELLRKTGSRDMCVSRIPEEWKNPAGIAEYAVRLTNIAEELAAEDMTLSFHPTAPDYLKADSRTAGPQTAGLQPANPRAAGQRQTADDSLLANLLASVPQMKICLDLYHCNKAGADMCDFLHRYAGRVTMVHFKEGRRLPDGSEILVPAGQGDIDWTGVKNACLLTGVSYAFAEQEKWDRDPYICLQEAVSFIEGLK